MATDRDYAVLSLAAYSPDDSFRSFVDFEQAGWVFQSTLAVEDLKSGFYGAVFKKGIEYVVAFRGTNPEQGRDWQNDLQAASGVRSKQISKALLLVSKMQQHGISLTNVSFTGHSLGGGLAGVIATFLGRPAVTFAAAPFENSVTDLPITDGWLNRRLEQSVNEYYREYVSQLTSLGLSDADASASFSAFNQAWTTGHAEGMAEFGEREVQIRDLYVTADPVFQLESPLVPAIAGTRTPFDIGDQTVSTVFGLNFKRHDVELVALLNASPTLLQGAFTAHRSLLELLSSDQLFGSSSGNGRSESVYVNLLRDHYSTNPEHQGVIDRFAQDLSLRLGNMGAVAQVNGGKMLENGVIAALLEYYFYKDGTAADFLTTVGNGVQFDLSRIPTWNPPGLAGPAIDDPRGGRGIWELVQSLPTVGELRHDIEAQGQALATPLWTVQQGANGLVSTGDAANEVQVGSPDAANTLTGGGGDDVLFGGSSGNSLNGDAGRDYLFGGSGVDSLFGGADVDYLVGGAGVDTLNGGAGDDKLFGGEGADVYQFSFTDGSDTISDLDGGLIKIGGQDLSGVSFTRVGENAWKATIASQDIFVGVGLNVLTSTYTVVLRNATNSLHIVISDWTTTNNFGLAFTPGGTFTPTQTGTIGSNPGTNLGWPPTWDPLATIRSYDGMDNLRGTSSADQLWGNEGNDSLEGREGNDHVDGGTGNDLIIGGNGTDTIDGGADRDIIFGDYGSTSAGSAVGSSPGVAYVKQNPSWTLNFNGLGWGMETPSGGLYSIFGMSVTYAIGAADIIDAGSGDDDVFAGEGNDVVFGGAGIDSIVGGPGDDRIDGGTENDLLVGDGQTSEPGLFRYSEDLLWGADTLHGGDGNDYLYGEQHRVDAGRLICVVDRVQSGSWPEQVRIGAGCRRRSSSHVWVTRSRPGLFAATSTPSANGAHAHRTSQRCWWPTSTSRLPPPGVEGLLPAEGVNPRLPTRRSLPWIH